ncbi:MAG: DUF1566 domain-containing protein [Leptospiraceae bacterium]|nr:DUF1566 domain-containing protein [Leptospiraceae bacterium]
MNIVITKLFIKEISLLGIVIFFANTNCLKAKRSLFDTSSQSGFANALLLSQQISAGNRVVATPTFSNPSGHYSTSLRITISSTTGSSIYFTRDGSEPSASSTLYTSSIHISSLAGRTLKAIALKTGFTKSAVATAEYSYSVLKSGQTTSYATGDDGATQLGVARSYTDNGDGTVTDSAMDLVWQKCSRGQNNDAICSGAATTANWAEAGAYCTGLIFASKIWRLPSRLELETLPDYGISNPVINGTVFPATVASSYWSSTTDAIIPANAWLVSFTVGIVNTNLQSSGANVRCVSGEAKASSSFTDTGDGTVKDKSTGLVWQKCSNGQNNDSTCSGTASSFSWTLALSNCNGLSLAGRAWRLPSVKELKSIVDLTRTTAPTIDTSIFPNTNSNYWSSSTNHSSPTLAWSVNFDTAAMVSFAKVGSNLYRCVSEP